MAAGDFMLLTVHTTNQVVSAITGWTAVTSTPVGTGTAGAAGGTRVSTYYRFWQSGDAAPTVAVTGGNCTNGIIVGYSGVDSTTPFDGVTPVATTLATAATTLTMTGLTTASNNGLIFWSVARDVDVNSTTGVTGFTNANLTGIAEVHDQTVNTGPGGGIWVGYGFKATAGATGNLTVTQTSSVAVGVTIALRPSSDVTLAVTGVAATGAAGTVGVDETVPITGVSDTGDVGSVAAAVNIELSGTQATGQVGIAGVAITVPTSGVEATGSVGTVSNDAPITVSLSGVEAVGSVGFVAAGAPPIIVVNGGHFGYDEKKRGKLWDAEKKNEKQRKRKLRAELFGLPPEVRETITTSPGATIARAAVTQIDYQVLMHQVQVLKRRIEIEHDENEIEMLLL